ncbi:MAG TPA: methionine ABC transporter permease [Ruminococcaceae bacterium]|nr:methionine ABC transporter permease [Oscillospiraceae bacterium]
MGSTLNILQTELLPALWQTVQMVIISMIIALIVGMALGLVLFLTENPLFYRNRIVNGIASFIVNLIRSIPFIILLVLLIPLTQLLIGTSIGPIAASVSLSISATAFFARLVEGALSEVDKGVIEASKATGAGFGLILHDVLLVEALPGLVRAITVTIINVIGFSAMAGIVGGGGIGNLAIQYGYYRYETGVMIVTVVILVIIVQGAQAIGDAVARKFTRE